MFARVPVFSTNIGFSVENTNLGFSAGYVLCASYVHGQQAGCNYHCKSIITYIPILRTITKTITLIEGGKT